MRGHALSPSGAADLTVTTATLASNGAPLHRPRADHFLGPSNSNGAVGGSFTVRLPDWAPLGIYRIRIGLHDNLRPALSEVVLRFAVEDRSLAAAASLEIRDFQLSSIRDGPPLPVSGPLLYGGGALYLRLRLFGVRFQGDQVKVRIGARLTGPGGNVVLDRPDWMEIGDRYEGHPANFFLPVRGELAAPADLEKGIHTATFTFTDDFSSATVARQARFEAAPGG
ncbi:MAG: hypothetical protein HY013_07140 [Candidatus Solibacter usitatus]|nr:hypothetical protein [Candidatus Solibacter usitatus]